MIIGISGKKQSGKNTVALIWQLLDVWYNTEEKTNFDGMMSDTQYVEYMLEDDKISYNKSSWQQKSFAHKIKQILCILTGCTIEQLESEEFKNSKLPEEWAIYFIADMNEYDPCVKIFSTREEAVAYKKEYGIWGDIVEHLYTYREALQFIGTDLFRDKFHPKVWVNSLFSDYKLQHFRTVKVNGVFSHQEMRYPKWIISDVRFFNEAQAIKDRGGILIRVDRDSDSKDSHVSENALNTYKDWKYVIDNNYSLSELILRVKEIMFKEGIIYE